MHDTAYEIGRQFFETYCGQRACLILEVGSQNVNGTLRDCAPPGGTYVGVDMTAGKGVDIVLTDPHVLPFADEYFDATLASSCLEHDQMFWVTFLEMLRVTKTGGYLYLNTPSNGSYHSYPYDNWRFYPDSGLALLTWARRQGYAASLMESFIARRKADVWNDCVLVFRKGTDDGSETRRIVDQLANAYNIRRGESGSPTNYTPATEDMLLQQAARQQLAVRDQEIARLNAMIKSSEAALAGLAASISAAAEPRFAALTETLAANAAHLAALQSASDKMMTQLAPLRVGLQNAAAAISELRRTTESRLPPAGENTSGWRRLFPGTASRQQR